ncbi:unnamed protein product [Periconia digitata]|uniref:Uncharacterized protein n=1 Tax=Periconia digitata TaxID=1303443 RepID=A0A9W4UQS5_9PLEO|nr:unnamed protein product [Periconia digitata]
MATEPIPTSAGETQNYCTISYSRLTLSSSLIATPDSIQKKIKKLTMHTQKHPSLSHPPNTPLRQSQVSQAQLWKQPKKA